MTEPVDREGAARRMVEAFSAFSPYYADEAPDPGEEILLHPVMGAFARFYLEQELADQPDLVQRYWSLVEELASSGDDYVKEAVHSSLIEYFAWGNESEQAALRNAEPVQGSATKAIVVAYAEWAERVARCTHDGTLGRDDGPPWITRCTACGRRWVTSPDE